MLDCANCQNQCKAVRRVPAPLGLGFLLIESGNEEGYFDPYGWDGWGWDGWDDGSGYYGSGQDYSDWQGLLDWWDQLNAPDLGVLDAQESEPGGAASNNNWQGLLDWWRDFTGGYTGNQPGTNDGGGMVYGSGPGYCPAGYYHPLNDPNSCVPFPDDPVARQQVQRQQQQAQQRPPQKPSAKQAQPLPPCPTLPNGQRQVRDKKTGKCVSATLSNQLAAAGPGGLPWWALLLFGAVAVKALQK